MKKYFLSLVAIAAAMLFATSCQESLVEPQVAGPTTFTVQLPDQMGTKAYGDEDFTNATINTLYVEVYDSESKELFHKPDPIKVENGEAKFSLNLVQNQEYDIIFWAQKGDAYEIIDLRTIEMNANHHNVERGAAFYAVLDNFKPVNGNQPVVLTRPFAQLNLGTRLGTSYGQAKLISSTIEVTGAATHFNTVGEACETTTTFTYVNDQQPCPYVQLLNVGGEDFAYVSMDYLAVPGTQSALIKVKATIVVEDKEGIQTTLVREIESVPVQKNYRTNIVGNLITSETDFSVSIDSDFAKDGDTPLPDNRYVVVTDVDAANQALASGETFIAINKIKDNDVINLGISSAEVFYLQIPESAATLTIQGENAKEVYLHVQNNTAIDAVAKLIINTPNGTVTVTGPGVKLNSIEATTASNTLILDGIKVADLDVHQGNVVAQNVAIVDNLDVVEDNTNIEVTVVEDGSSVTVNSESADNVEQKTELPDGVVLNEEGVYEISNATGLIWFAEKVLKVNNDSEITDKTLKVKLINNIDLTGVTTDGDSFAPIGRYCSKQGVNAPFKGHFDGNNKTIKGVYQSGWNFGYEWGTTGYLGLFGYVMDATIENLTIEGMESVVEGGTLAAIAGRADGECTFKNITVKDTKLGTYNNRCGGIVGWTGGYYKDEAETEVACYFTFENINICEDVVLGGLWGSFDSSIGGIMGQLNPAGSASFKNVTVSCRIDAYNDCTASYDYYNYRMCGMLIGQMTKTTEIDGRTYPDVAAYNIEFDNVTVNYGTWMNYHYCEPTPGLNGGRGMRVEAGFTYDGLPADFDHTQCVDNHYNCIPFDQLFGGVQTACKGVKAWEGVTVNYPEEYTCPLCGEQHNVD